MCGRYAITLPPEAVRAFFEYVEQPNFPPRFNVAPTQPIPIVVARERTGGLQRHFQLVRWGFLPGFVKDPKTFPLLINARAEGVADKPSFRAAFRRRRCLVVADAFYEWRVVAPKQPKQPYLIRRIDRAPLGFAGLYETYMDATGGEIDTACIITTGANKLMRHVHERMPVMLPRENFSAWLDGEATPLDAALDMLRPAPEDALEFVPISAAVGNVANNAETVQTPIGPPFRAAAE